MIKNIWQRYKQIWTHCFSVVTYYAVSYYRFLNTNPEVVGLANPWGREISFDVAAELFSKIN
jgi:hypothetical protein